MPIYEYHCEPCDQDFEALIRSAEDVPRCPRCGGQTLTRQLSVPAAAQAGRRGEMTVCNPGPMMGGGCGASGCGGGMCGMG